MLILENEAYDSTHTRSGSSPTSSIISRTAVNSLQKEEGGQLRLEEDVFCSGGGSSESLINSTPSTNHEMTQMLVVVPESNAEDEVR